MKKLAYRFAWGCSAMLILANCSSSEKNSVATPALQTAAGPSPARLFANTASSEAAELAAAAAALVHRGEFLPSAQAERCWKNEERRPAVREACMVAWVKGSDSSELLLGALKEHGASSRALALAAISRKELIEKADFPELVTYLGQLKADPPWVRGIALEAWLKNRDSPDTITSQYLWDALGVDPKKAEEIDPASAGTAYRLAKILGQGFDDQLRAAFCMPSAGEMAQIRCFRFLSTLVSNGESSLDEESIALIPQGKAREQHLGWVFFQRSFPERAQLLSKF